MKVKKKKRGGGKYGNIVDDFGIDLHEDEQEEYLRESPIFLADVDVADDFTKELEDRFFTVKKINSPTRGGNSPV